MNDIPKSLFNVELVPRTCFYTNVRSNVTKGEWDVLRRAAYKRAGYTCKGCNVNGRLEAHEIFSYNDANKLQKLEDIIALCHLCHMAHHLGFAKIKGEITAVREHLRTINGWSQKEMETYENHVFSVWRERSEHDWRLDLSWLDNQE